MSPVAGGSVGVPVPVDDVAEAEAVAVAEAEAEAEAEADGDAWRWRGGLPAWPAAEPDPAMRVRVASYPASDPEPEGGSGAEPVTSRPARCAVPVTNAACVADVVGAAVSWPPVVDVLVVVGVAVAVDVPAGVAVAVPDALDAGVTWACDCVAGGVVAGVAPVGVADAVGLSSDCAWSAPASVRVLPLYPNHRATTPPAGRVGTVGLTAGWVPASTTSGS